MVKLGIIGLGHMGGYHAALCALSPNINLVGVADHSEQNLAKIKSPTVIKAKDYNEWIDQVDAVIIAVPTDFHYDIAKDCLIKRKHILLEKPLTKEIWQAEELVALAEKMAVTLHVGHIERFNGAVQELKKIINEPYLIESHRMGPFSPRVQKDSVVLDLMIHDLDIIINLVGSPVVKINAVGKKVHSQTCDIAVVQLSFENGVIANIVSSRASQIKKRSMAIHQKDSFIHLDFTTQDISIQRQTSASVQLGNDQLRYKQESTVEHVFVYKDNPLKLEIEHFIKSITSKTDMVNPEQDVIALKITTEIEKILGLR